MNALINLAPSFLGLGYIWNKLDGYKTAIAALGLGLHATAAFVLLLAGMADQAAPLLAAHNLAGLVHMAQGLQGFSSNPAVVDFGSAWSKFYATLGVVGLGHKLEKASGDAPTAEVVTAIKAVVEGAKDAAKPAA